MNLYDFPKGSLSEELCSLMLKAENLRIERIISTGQSSPPGLWYDQPEDEWVLLVQGEAVIEYENYPPCRLKAGDSLLLPAHIRHRVADTSTQPPCIWVCVFGTFDGTEEMEETDASE